MSLGTHELWLCQKVLCSVGGARLTDVSQCFRQGSLILFILKKKKKDKSDSWSVMSDLFTLNLVFHGLKPERLS